MLEVSLDLSRLLVSILFFLGWRLTPVASLIYPVEYTYPQLSGFWDRAVKMDTGERTGLAEFCFCLWILLFRMRLGYPILYISSHLHERVPAHLQTGTNTCITRLFPFCSFGIM